MNSTLPQYIPSYSLLNSAYTHQHDRSHSGQNINGGGYNLGQAGPGPSSIGSGSGSARMISDNQNGYFSHALRENSLSPVNGTLTSLPFGIAIQANSIGINPLSLPIDVSSSDLYARFLHSPTSPPAELEIQPSSLPSPVSASFPQLQRQSSHQQYLFNGHATNSHALVNGNGDMKGHAINNDFNMNATGGIRFPGPNGGLFGQPQSINLGSINGHAVDYAEAYLNDGELQDGDDELKVLEGMTGGGSDGINGDVGQEEDEEDDEGEGGEEGDEEGEEEKGEEDEEGEEDGGGEGEDELDNEEPLYVNAKQYHRILKRRLARARLEELNRLSRSRKVSHNHTLPVYSEQPYSTLFLVLSSTTCINRDQG